MHPPFDPGLQAERTELAWRRTALALAIGSLVMMRLLPGAFGDPLWMLPGLLGVAVTPVILILARNRYRHLNAQGRHALTAPDVPDGRVLILVSGIVALGGLGALLLVLRVAA